MLFPIPFLAGYALGRTTISDPLKSNLIDITYTVEYPFDSREPAMPACLHFVLLRGPSAHLTVFYV
jgi:hypothetical protein